jgi:hypothetical protein
MRERSYEAHSKRESWGHLIPQWMKTKKAILVFVVSVIVMTVLAYFIDSLRYIFPLTGIIIIIGAYSMGGGRSELHRASPITRTGIKAMMEHRYGGSASDWGAIAAGFVIGGLVFLSGLLGALVDILL